MRGACHVSGGVFRLMRIGIDAASIVGDKGGVGWHTHHLLRALLDLEEETEISGSQARFSASRPARWLAGERSNALGGVAAVADVLAGSLGSSRSIPWPQFQDDRDGTVRRHRHHSRSMACSSSRIFEESAGTGGIVAARARHGLAGTESR